MLIHHKINLQNAADMAAYSGAAEQARILSTIGWKNYELRKNLKEFAYFYWVAHSSYNQGFPQSPSQAVGHFEKAQSAGQREWRPMICRNDEFDTNSKFGHNGQRIEVCKFTEFNFPEIIEPNFTFGRLGNILTNELKPLKEAFTGQCQEYGEDNKEHAENDSHIYKDNADSILSQIEDMARALNKEEEDSTNNTFNHSEFTSSIPRKWDAAATYSREGRSTAIQPLPKDIGTIAYQTAWKNLSSPNKMGFQFIPIKPAGHYLQLESFKKDYILNYMAFPIRGSKCEPQAHGLPIRDFPVAVRKDKKNPTYYSVRLASRPWLPFLPGLSQPTLEAYAAAKPFGGRIGPEHEDALIMDSHPPGNFGIPNFSLWPGDQYGLRDKNTLYNLSLWSYMYKYGLNQAQANEESRHSGRAALRAANFYEADKYTFNMNNDAHYPRETDHPDLLPAISKANNPFVVTSPNTLNSGWGGRAGYSVKFVSFQELLGYDNPPSDIPARDRNLAH